MSKFLTSLQMASIIAWRHWQIFRRDFFANVSPTVAEPMLFVIVFGYWLGSHVSNYGSKTYLVFVAPGIAAMSALFSAFFEGSYSFFVRLELEGVFKAMLTTPVEPKEILWGELLWIAAKGAIMATMVSFILLLLDVVQMRYIFLMPVVGVLTAISCGAIGLISSCHVRNIHQFQVVYAWIISPMFFMSGMFVPTELMPSTVQYLCWLSPFYHGVKLAQATLWAENLGLMWLQHGSCLVVLAAGLILWANQLIMPRLRI